MRRIILVTVGTVARANFLITILGILFLCVGLNSSAQVQTYCTNIGGNISCTSYDHGASSQSYCTSIAGNLSCTTYDDDYSQVQIRQNYEAGKLIGTALGNVIVAAIEEYKAHKRDYRDKQNQWNQFVQDVVAKQELECETDRKYGESPIECRQDEFLFNQFLHKHQKDFPPDAHNMFLLADAAEKLEDQGVQFNNGLAYEKAFASIDKKQLDKKLCFSVVQTAEHTQELRATGCK